MTFLDLLLLLIKIQNDWDRLGNDQMKQCANCRNENNLAFLEDDVQLTVVKNLSKHNPGKEVYMCREHREFYTKNGYEIKLKKDKKQGARNHLNI